MSQWISTLSALSLSDLFLSLRRHRTKQIDCSGPKKHEVNKNEVIDVSLASSVANSTISLIEIAFEVMK